MKKIALGLVIAVVAVVSQAAEGYSFTSSLGRVHSSLELPASYTADESSTTWALTGGYRFSSNWGAEIGYRDFGKQQIRGTQSATTLTGTAWTYGGLYAYQVNPSAEILFRGGAFQWNVSSTGTTISGRQYGSESSGTRAYLGAGLLWKVNDPISIGVNWTRYKSASSSRDDADVIEASVQYRFK